MSALGRLLRSARPDWPWYAAALLAAPVAAGLPVVQPWLLRLALDEGVAKADLRTLSLAAAGFLATGVVGFVFEAGYTLATAIGASRSIARIRQDVFRHLCSLGASFHDREPSGKLLARVTSDVEALGETLSAGAVTLVLDALLILGIAGSLVWMNGRMALVLLLVAPPIGLVVEVARRRLRALFTLVRTRTADLLAYFAERLAGAEVVQLYSREASTQAAFEGRVAGYLRANLDTNVWDALLFATVDGASSATMALVLGYGASPWVDGLATAGLLAAFVDGVGKLFGPIRELSGKLAVIQRALASVEKLSGVLVLEERVPEGARDLVGPPGAVTLDGVSFGYRPGEDVVRDVSFRVEPGQVVALVGRTGSGKSTIGKLLLAQYGGYRGEIRIDGVPLGDLSHAALRGRVAAVPQDVALFPDTVRFNLTLGAPLSDDRLREAVRLAQAEEVVARLGGLEGRIEAQGKNLSVGEGQLLAIARVLCRDAPFVVMDEATASVDSVTEARILEATRALFAGRTCLVVAHRLSTIREAHHVVVLDAGRVAEQGPPAVLASAGGRYAALVGEAA